MKRILCALAVLLLLAGHVEASSNGLLSQGTSSGGGSGSGTVTSVSTNNGLTGGTITTSGTIGFATITNNSGLCNNSGSTAAPTSANCAVTGTGNLVLGTSPTLVTPALGTPSAAVLTNATGLPIATGVSGLGTGVATFLATPSSANLLTALTTSTGSGVAVFGTSPTFTTNITTPTILGGSASSSSITEESTSGVGSTDFWRVLTGSQTEQIRITSAGLVGITSTIPRAVLDISQNTGAIILPVGTTGQRPGTPINGMERYNSTAVPAIEGYINNAWAPLATTGVINEVTVLTSTASSPYVPATGTNSFISFCKGGGGSGAGGGTAGAGAGSAGNATTLGTTGSVCSVGGGAAGTWSTGAAAAGGTSTTGTYKSAGAPSASDPPGSSALIDGFGALGGAGLFGEGAGLGGTGAATCSAGGDGTVNTGAGGGGGGTQSTSGLGGGGGGSGGFAIAYVNSSIAASYAYVIGAQQTTVGSAGTSGCAGGKGAAGVIVIIGFK